MKKLALTKLAFHALLAISMSVNAAEDIAFATTEYITAMNNEEKCIDLRANVLFTYGSYKNGTMTECSYGKAPTVEFHFPLGKKFEKSDKDEMYKVLELTAKQIVGENANFLAESGACEKNFMEGITCQKKIKFNENSSYILVAMIAEKLDYLIVKYIKL